jgi:hypothetical protein
MGEAKGLEEVTSHKIKEDLKNLLYDANIFPSELNEAWS